MFEDEELEIVNQNKDDEENIIDQQQQQLNQKTNSKEENNAQTQILLPKRKVSSEFDYSINHTNSKKSSNAITQIKKQITSTSKNLLNEDEYII